MRIDDFSFCCCILSVVKVSSKTTAKTLVKDFELQQNTLIYFSSQQVYFKELWLMLPKFLRSACINLTAEVYREKLDFGV